MTQLTCVLRKVAGLDQYIPLADAVSVSIDEPVFSGSFNQGKEKDGPSGSHERTVCDPLGTPTRSTVRQTACVFRQVKGIDQWVPLKDAAWPAEGERVFFGQWRTETVNDGPSGSHARTICLPVSGQPVEKVLSLEPQA